MALTNSTLASSSSTGAVGFLAHINSVMSQGLGNAIPDNPFTHLFITYPLYILGTFFIIAFVAAIFLDFLPDAWKIPFAIVVDVLDLIAITNPGTLDIVAAVAAFATFFILTRDTGRLRYVFGTVGAIKCLLPFGFARLFPLNTIMMLISTVADRGL